MNLNVETFHGTSLQRFGYHQKSFSYIESATPFLPHTIEAIPKAVEYHFSMGIADNLSELNKEAVYLVSKFDFK